MWRPLTQVPLKSGGDNSPDKTWDIMGHKRKRWKKWFLDHRETRDRSRHPFTILQSQVVPARSINREAYIPLESQGYCQFFICKAKKIDEDMRYVKRISKLDIVKSMAFSTGEKNEKFAESWQKYVFSLHVVIKKNTCVGLASSQLIWNNQRR